MHTTHFRVCLKQFTIVFINESYTLNLFTLNLEFFELAECFLVKLTPDLLYLKGSEFV